MSLHDHRERAADAARYSAECLLALYLCVCVSLSLSLALCRSVAGGACAAAPPPCFASAARTRWPGGVELDKHRQLRIGR